MFFFVIPYILLNLPRAISDTSPLDIIKIWAKLTTTGGIEQRTAGLVGFDENNDMEIDNVFHARGDTFLAADEVKAGKKVKLYNLSGCSAIFVIGAD